MARPRLLRFATFGIVVLSALFPPWRAESIWGEAGTNHQELKCGYGFLLSGPGDECEGWARIYNGHIDVEQLAVEWVGIAALAGIARLALPEWW